MREAGDEISFAQGGEASQRSPEMKDQKRQDLQLIPIRVQR